MKRLGLIVLGLLCCVIIARATDRAQYAPGVFVVKFKAHTEQLERWLESNRRGQISELSSFVGMHSTEAYISDATMTALRKKYHEQMTTLSLDNPIEDLGHIAIVHVPQVLNLDLLINKMKNLGFIEYVERVPMRYTTFTPNDTLFSDLGQYYVKNTKATDAWDQLPGTSTALIAIVDTGVDYNHEDLKSVIYSNPGETGLDSLGRDKRTNGVDDDNNGFVDDWHGWDFAGVMVGASGDNDPKPGYLHGTHCAGIAGAAVNNKLGIAGMCHRASILPVKIGTESDTLTRSYEGVAYAAAMGAGVISCSWGGGARSQGEQDVITAATKLGSLIVVAAGNEGVEQLFYPGAYKGVLAVASVGRNDVKSSFSNYGTYVGISAPGQFILSTIPGGQYTYLDGTSMACPCVAGAAALVRLKYPSYTPGQVSAVLRASADVIDNKNGNRGQAWMYKTGNGRVNALRAVTPGTYKIADIVSFTVNDADGDGVFDQGNVISIIPTVQNQLSDLSKVHVVLAPSDGSAKVSLSVSDQLIGPMTRGEVKPTPAAYKFTVPANVAENATLSFDALVYEDTTVVGRSSVTMVVKPTYRTMSSNNITITVNSRGNFGYNDYSGNFQGEGMRYKGSSSFLFEAGLMVASSADNLSDVVRGNPASTQDSAFHLKVPVSLATPGTLANAQCQTEFVDHGPTIEGIGEAHVSVKQNVLQYNGNGRDNFVITTYDITNIDPQPVKAMYAGIYADWDIDNSGQNNEAIYDEQLGFYYVRATAHNNLPWVGMQLLTPQKLNVFMMDNDGTTQDNPGVYDNYTADEKFMTLSSGIARTHSNITDISAVIGAGPFPMQSQETVRVAFSIFAGNNLEELKVAAKAARDAMPVTDVSEGENLGGPALSVRPMPANLDQASIEIRLNESTSFDFEIIDALGAVIAHSANNQQKSAGTYIFALNSLIQDAGHVGLGGGTYFVRLHTPSGIFVKPFIVLP